MPEEEFEITVNAERFVETLNTLSSIIHPKESELVKKQVMIEAFENNLSLTTVNETTLLKAMVDGKVETTGKACLDINYLISLISKFSGEVKIVKSGDSIRVLSGKSKYRTSSFPIEEFISLTEYEDFEGDFVKIEVSYLKESLECVYSSGSKDNDTLSAAYVAHDVRGDQHCIVCSNSELGAGVIKEALAPFPQGAIPKFIVDFILKLKDARILEYKEKDGLFRGKVGNYEFAYRAPEFEYPWGEIKALLDSHPNLTKSFKFNKEMMVEALERISLITDKATHSAKIVFAGHKITVIVEGPGSNGEEEIPLLEPVEEEYSIMMDSVYLMSVLKEFEGNIEWSCDGSEEAQFISDGYLIKFFMGLM